MTRSLSSLDRGVLTAFGGFGSGTFPGSVGAGTHLADTWQRDLRRRAGWRLATPAEETEVAIAREGTAYAHDAESHRLLMFGGLTGDTTLADVWMADLRRPGRPHWEQLCSPTSCGPAPTARWGAHAIYDPVADRLVVFGGSTGTGATTNDVWALELSGPPMWHELTPAGPAPAARWSAGYGYDPVRRRLVVFGGQTGPDGTGSPLQDTWALSLDGDAALDTARRERATAGAPAQPGSCRPGRGWWGAAHRGDGAHDRDRRRSADITTTCGHSISATTQRRGFSSPPIRRVPIGA